MKRQPNTLDIVYLAGAIGFLIVVGVATLPVALVAAERRKRIMEDLALAVVRFRFPEIAERTHRRLMARRRAEELVEGMARSLEFMENRV